MWCKETDIQFSSFKIAKIKDHMTRQQKGKVCMAVIILILTQNNTIIIVATQQKNWV